MKTAITSTGNMGSSVVDSRFGRCAWFVIYDPEGGSTEFIPNPYAHAEEEAGAESVKLLISRKVERIISGEFGIKIKPMLDINKIQMIVITGKEKTIDDIIGMLSDKS